MSNFKIFIIFSIILHCAFFFKGYSQEVKQKERKVLLLVEANYVRRFGIFSKTDFMYYPSPAQVIPFYSLANQLTGMGLNLGISLSNRKGWGVKYSNTIRYNHIYYTLPIVDTTTSSISSPGVNVQGLIVDYNLNLIKVFRPRKPVQHIMEVGLAFMNRGTNYSYAQYFGGGTGSFMFEAVNVNYSIQKNRFKAGLGLYYSKSPFGYPDLKSLILSEVKVGYTFNPL